MINEIPIHVVNLARRVERKLNLIKEFEKHNLTNYTFYNAVDGLTLDIKDISNLINGGTLNRGQYGCYLSHLNIFKEILNSNIELHLVLEDDVYFSKDFKTKFNELFNKIKDVSWDIFYIGINHEVNSKRGSYIGPLADGIYYPKYSVWGTHAYLIKKETLRTIISQLLPIKYPIDSQLMSLDIAKLVLSKPIVITNNSTSDTQSWLYQ